MDTATAFGKLYDVFQIGVDVLATSPDAQQPRYPAFARNSLEALLAAGRVLLADGATGTNYFQMGLETTQRATAPATAPADHGVAGVFEVRKPHLKHARTTAGGYLSRR